MNHLIELLPRPDRLRLLAASQLVPLAANEILSQRGTPTRHIYFPTDGFVALATQGDGHAGLGVCLVGREGMLGAQLALGMASAPLAAQVRGRGTAWRIGTAAFRRQLGGSVAMRNQLDACLVLLVVQLATLVDCIHRHHIRPRLARWLLMSHDQAGTDSFHVTQEFMAAMLGVRRVGVTVAAGALQHSGFIEYSRGELTVLDRRGLESAACSCYVAPGLKRLG